MKPTRRLALADLAPRATDRLRGGLQLRQASVQPVGAVMVPGKLVITKLPPGPAPPSW